MPNGFGKGLRIDVGTLPQHRGPDIVGIIDDASVLNVQDASPRVVCSPVWRSSTVCAR